jgi:hypothetical protein
MVGPTKGDDLLLGVSPYRTGVLRDAYDVSGASLDGREAGVLNLQPEVPRGETANYPLLVVPLIDHHWAVGATFLTQVQLMTGWTSQFLTNAVPTAATPRAA